MRARALQFRLAHARALWARRPALSLIHPCVAATRARRAHAVAGKRAQPALTRQRGLHAGPGSNGTPTPRLHLGDTPLLVLGLQSHSRLRIRRPRTGGEIIRLAYG